ncbi:MAG TPA: outer membrane beta-barrel protein [Flavobacteriales bacterium]|nr:outer membrane beta-barrel protein [Flavobacteriales bacterium]
MKTRNLVLSLLCVAAGHAAQAQFAVNPQAGINFTQLTNTPSGIVSSSSAGWQLGADFRLGDRFYFQPGAFFGRSVTFIKFTPLDTVFVEDNMIRTTAKVKALVGYNLIHSEGFKLRVNAGPTYEALLSIDSKDDKIAFNKKDYNGGSFNLDAGLGVDLWKISLETGLSYGLSKAYKDAGQFMKDSKYFTWYATLGIVLGGGPQ